MALTPRPHQIEGLRWCLERKNPVLFWEQRTGKTLVAILYAQRIGARNVLVIAPNSALGSWEEQIEGEGLRHVRVRGTRKQRLSRFASEDGWYLVNKEGWVSVPEMWRIRKWDLVIMDESASIIRYPSTKTTRYYLNDFQFTGPRMVLTGRPDPQNEVLPYWTQMAWAFGGSWMGCSSFWQWRSRFFYKSGFRWKPKAKGAIRIKEQIQRDASILMRKDIQRDVSKTIGHLRVDLDERARAIYETAEKELVLVLENEPAIETKWTVVKYNWLRQITAGVIHGQVVHTAKVDALRDLLHGALDGEKVVVVGCFTSEIEHAYRAFPEGEAECLTGKVPASRRREIVDRFNRGSTRILLCQVKVIDTGMDLHGAKAIVYLSLPLSVLSWVQSQDRILGDLSRRDALVVVIQARGTIDEIVLEAVTASDRKSYGLLREIQRRIVESVHRRSREDHRVVEVGGREAARLRDPPGEQEGVRVARR